MLSIYSDLFSKRKGGKSLRQLVHHESGRAVLVEVLDAVQRVVDALTNPEGGRYVVSLSDQGAASGDLNGKRIVISYKPLTDKSLNLAQVTEVMTGLTTHEIGHTVISLITKKVLQERFADASGVDPLAKFLANVADDEKLERYMTARFPGIGGSFRPTLEWVTRQYKVDQKVFKMSADLDLVGRTNLAIAAFRYPFAVRWVKNALTRREREWWQAWANRYAETGEDEDAIEALLREGLTRLGAPDLSDPEQPEQEQESDEGEGDEQGDESGESNESDDPTGESKSDKDEQRPEDPSQPHIPNDKPEKGESSEDEDELEDAEESALDQIGNDEDESDDDEGDDLDEDDDLDGDDGEDLDEGDPEDGDEGEGDEGSEGGTTDEDGNDLDEESEDLSDEDLDGKDTSERGSKGGEDGEADEDDDDVDLSENDDLDDDESLTDGESQSSAEVEGDIGDDWDEGESGDAESSNPDAEGERTHESETFDSPSEGSMDENAEGGQGEQASQSENAEAMTDPWKKERLNEAALSKGIDNLLDEAGRYGNADEWQRRQLQQVLDQERTVEKIKSRDGFGTMKVYLDL